MTRHDQVARTTAPRRRRSMGCYVHIAVEPIVTRTNPVGINAPGSATWPGSRFHDIPTASYADVRDRPAHPEAQIPIGSRLRPAGSCMRDFRTPDGTRNPSALRTFVLQRKR